MELDDFAWVVVRGATAGVTVPNLVGSATSGVSGTSNPRAPRLGPWAFSISVVNSLERDFVWEGYSYVNASISS